MHPMSPIYADLIKDGLKTLDQVPEKNRAEVQALLDANAEN
ncbi:CD1375 family protein [Brevibacillus reuszeri]|nr:CD1375 family protein [Brevibacillus reuszeri]